MNGEMSYSIPRKSHSDVMWMPLWVTMVRKHFITSGGVIEKGFLWRFAEEVSTGRAEVCDLSLRPSCRWALQPAQPLLGSRCPQERKAASPQGGEGFSHRPVPAQSPRLHTQGLGPRPQGKHPAWTVCKMQVLDKCLKACF